MAMVLGTRYRTWFVTPIALFCFFALSSCIGRGGDAAKQITIPIMNFNELSPLLNRDNDTVYIVNFWATWCAPCVKEIPHFERISKEYSASAVRVILVNLDFPIHYETRLLPFVQEWIVSSKVIMLNDPDANSWIPRVHEGWTGSIPATLIYRGSSRIFLERELSYEDLVVALLRFF